MGPSIFVDGELPLSARSAACAPSFNGAVDLRRRRAERAGGYPVDGRALQWGRRSSSTERCATRRAGSPTTPSFNGAVDLRRRRDSAGIMITTVEWELQWGRRSSSTESGADLGGADLGGALQWGRRSSSTERRRGDFPSIAPTRFNGAV